MYAVGLPIKEATRKGYKMAYEGDSIDISYYSTNTRRGRVGHKIAHTLTTGSTQGTPCFIDMNRDPKTTEIARCLTAKQNGGIRKHKREASGVLCNGRIRRLIPRECLRLQGWTDDRIDKVLASANFFYKLWKRIRKYNGLITGMTQNVDELLRSDTARLMLANSEFLIMLNQSATDRTELAKLLNISDTQLGYITNVPAGCGLIRCAGNLVPFTNSFPRDTQLYRLMTTKPDEQMKG